MANDERFSGTFQGEEISCFREFGGHRFSDEEVDALLAGKVIAFKAHSAKTGNDYTAVGKLGKNDKGYWGFQMDFDLTPDVVFSEAVPTTWGGHSFTEDEKAALEAGERIHVAGLVSKNTGKEYDADLTFEKEEGSATRRIVPHFDN